MSPRVSGAGAISWFASEPERLARDRAEVAEAFPALRWSAEGAGGFDGALPLWPFPRPRPRALEDLTGARWLELELRYAQAYPMVAPSIRPLYPHPSVEKWTAHNWHVNGDGTLCLLQAHALWDPAACVVDLLLKAAGWRIEYALMQAHAIDAMSLNGIVSDPSFDALISDTAARISDDTDRTDKGSSEDHAAEIPADIDSAADAVFGDTGATQ
jgi:hypothetical protein